MVLQCQPMRGSMGPLSDGGPGIWSLHMRAAASPGANRNYHPSHLWGGLGWTWSVRDL